MFFFVMSAHLCDSDLCVVIEIESVELELEGPGLDVEHLDVEDQPVLIVQDVFPNCPLK